MKKSILILSVLFQAQLSFGQDFMNNEKDLLISRLMDLGFDTIQGSAKNIVDSSNFVLARFNDNYCSRLEYHLTQDSDEMNFCDSIYFTTECSKCFDVTWNEFVDDKQKKWKKESDSVFYSLKNAGKSILYGPPREIKFRIVKLEITEVNESTNPEFIAHNVWVAKSEYKRLKKLKTYH